jgi:hypothetical protein
MADRQHPVNTLYRMQNMREVDFIKSRRTLEQAALTGRECRSRGETADNASPSLG